MNIYLILGPPGSGKGTQAKKLAEKLGLVFFGTGDLMRREVEKGTDFGLAFKKIMDSGQLVNDDLISKFVEQKLKDIDLKQGIVFDGFPRTIGQAQNLEKFLSQKNSQMNVFNLLVKPESLILRMQKRRICEKCGRIFQDAVAEGKTKCDACGGKLILRNDDNSETLAKRIEVYEKQTAPLVSYYQEQGNLINIDGEPPIEEVWEEIISKFKNQKSKLQFKM